MNDIQTVRRLKGDDLRGLETLMSRYQVKATRAASLVTDVVQGTFTRIAE